MEIKPITFPELPATSLYEETLPDFSVIRAMHKFSLRLMNHPDIPSSAMRAIIDTHKAILDENTLEYALTRGTHNVD